MHRALVAVTLFVATAVLLAGCATAPSTEADRSAMHNEVTAAIASFKAKDPGMNEFFDGAEGYAVFPAVGKGAVGIGGAFGRGELYEAGEMTGYCDLTQVTIGFQLGGQAYSEVIFFETDAALSEFKTGNYAFSAQASAVAVTAGASTDADYNGGVAVFTMISGGLMYEASIGGQKFTYVPK